MCSLLKRHIFKPQLQQFDKKARTNRRPKLSKGGAGRVDDNENEHFIVCSSFSLASGNLPVPEPET